jgi:hypothetical protein
MREAFGSAFVRRVLARLQDARHHHLLLAARGVNIEAQLLGTRCDLGYALTGIGVDHPEGAVERPRAMSRPSGCGFCPDTVAGGPVAVAGGAATIIR